MTVMGARTLLADLEGRHALLSPSHARDSQLNGRGCGGQASGHVGMNPADNGLCQDLSRGCLSLPISRVTHQRSSVTRPQAEPPNQVGRDSDAFGPGLVHSGHGSCGLGHM